ncbi:MAG: NAD-dependent epimerase/dehydratase family protein [Pseudomonadota bacterium]|nr:NAD-dependent epimerase/dehydratase family protein [Pseudomonadota bacterium]
MTVAVTGASGHLGGNLVRALLAGGRRVRALVHREDAGALKGLPIEQAAGDVLDPRSLRAAFDGAEVVYHLAARISIVSGDAEEVFRVNVEGPRNVVAACLDAGVRRLVHFSSIHAVSHLPVDGPVDELRALTDHPDAPPYDRSKAAGQREILAGVARGLDAVIVNPTGVLGPFDFQPSRMGRLLLNIRSGRLPVIVEGGFDWVDVRDVVAGALAAERRGRTGEHYLLAGHWQSIAQVGALVAHVASVPAPRFVCPMWAARAVAPLAELASQMLGQDPLLSSIGLHAMRNHRYVTREKAERELGYSARPTLETIADTLRWFEERT